MNNFEQNMLEIKVFIAKYKTFKSVIEDLYLITLTDSYERLLHVSKINSLSENKIRNKIQYDFEHCNKKITKYINDGTITFNSESQIIQENNEVHRTDIKLFCAFYRKSFVIECKKFNPYNNDYIQGHLSKQENKYKFNGIERFTESIYAENDKYAGMIGFVCLGKIKKIIHNLKLKVKKFHLVTDSEDLLYKKCVNWQFSFQSKHIRKNNTEIHLYHLFFDFVKKNNSYERF